MMKYPFLIYVSIIFLFSSCHSLVDDEFPNYEPIPVLNSLLLADSTFKVQVSLTANLNDSATILVKNALVIIESNVDTPDTLVYTQKGWYISARTVKAGKSYTCKAIIPGYNTISASTTVPLTTEVRTVIFTDLASRGEEGEKISSFEFTIANNKTQKQYWMVQLVNEGLKSDYNFETGEWIEYYGDEEEYIYMLAEQDSVLLNEANPLTLFTNKFMKGDSYKVKFYINSNSTHLEDRSGNYYILLYTVDETYYRYLKQYYIYESAQYPSIGQSNQKYQMYSNVKNGLGLFTGMSVTRKVISAPNP